MKRIESLGQYLIKSEQCCRIVSLEEGFNQREAVLVIKHIEVAEHILILHVCAAECHCLVEDGKRITHRAVGLVSNNVERLVVDGHTLRSSHHTEVPYDVLNCDSVEIVSLATRQDGRKDLVFLSSRKNEDGVCRRFLESLEEGVERSLREHMHLVDDIHAVLAHLRRYADLVHQGLDVLDTVVGCRVKLVDTVRTSLSERLAGLASAARFHIRRRIGTVDHLCEDTCCSGLADASRSAEEVCVSELSSKNRVLESLGDIVLTDECPEGVRSVFSCRNYILRHNCSLVNLQI